MKKHVDSKGRIFITNDDDDSAPKVKPPEPVVNVPKAEPAPDRVLKVDKAEFLPPPPPPKSDFIAPELSVEEEPKKSWEGFPFEVVRNVPITIFDGVADASGWPGWKLTKPEEDAYERLLTWLIKNYITDPKYWPLIISLLFIASSLGMKFAGYAKFKKQQKEEEVKKEVKPMAAAPAPGPQIVSQAAPAPAPAPTSTIEDDLRLPKGKVGA